MSDDELTERTRGRRQDDFEAVDGHWAKRFAKWFLAGGGVLIFMAGVAYADIKGRVQNLERGQFTREEAAALRNTVDVLNANITFLRSDLNRLETRLENRR